MSQMSSQSAWNREKTERLKQLILGNIARQGTVLEACRQFEFETKGQYKAYQSFLRWWLVIRPGSGQEYRLAVGQRNHSVAPQGIQQDLTLLTEAGRQEIREATNVMQHANIDLDDELSAKLYNTVAEIIENRRQFKLNNHEYRKNLDLAQRKITEVTSDNRLLELELEKKESEIEKQERMLVESQYKYNQLQESYEQAQVRHENEYARFQQELKELQSNYERLTREYSNYRQESAKEIEHLQTGLQNAEMRNTQLTLQYEEVRKENVALSRSITDFAQQIANLVGNNAMPVIQPVPIRPTLASDLNENERAKA